MRRAWVRFWREGRTCLCGCVITSYSIHYTKLYDQQPIEVGCRQEPGRLVYYVRDHGPGIAPEEREAVFDIFYRGRSSKGSRGTGVGLAIVRKVALRCQGSAWVEETPGGGATFCLAVPRQPEA